MDRSEIIRRLRFGDLRTLCQSRYGLELPDDDAGRECLHDLLCLASLALVNPAKKMAGTMELYAPWIDAAASEAITGIVNRMPLKERWRV